MAHKRKLRVISKVRYILLLLFLVVAIFVVPALFHRAHANMAIVAFAPSTLYLQYKKPRHLSPAANSAARQLKPD
jgi:hypothetical protein